MPQLLERKRETPLPAALTEGEIERESFRRTLGFVTGVHLLVLVLFVVASRFQRPGKVEEIVWLDGGMLGGGGSFAPAQPETAAPEPEPEVEPEPVTPPTIEVPPELPAPPSKDEIALTKATPAPEPPKPATPKPATPRPATPKPVATPKPSTSKPKPKATPKPAPSPAKANATPAAEATKLTEKKEGSAEGTAKPNASGRGTASSASTGEGKGKGVAGKGPGAGSPSDFGEYASSLRDKYYAVWIPPSVPDAQSLIVTLKIRVKRDGTVLGQELVKSSGNSLMDGSVLAAAQQVTEIPPLPDGFGRGEIIDIPINFKPE